MPKEYTHIPTDTYRYELILLWVFKFCFRYCVKSTSDVNNQIDVVKSVENIINTSKYYNGYIRPNYGGKIFVSYFFNALFYGINLNISFHRPFVIEYTNANF